MELRFLECLRALALSKRSKSDAAAFLAKDDDVNENIVGIYDGDAGLLLLAPKISYQS